MLLLLQEASQILPRGGGGLLCCWVLVRSAAHIVPLCLPSVNSVSPLKLEVVSRKVIPVEEKV